jgi:hypothetical protein
MNERTLMDQIREATESAELLQRARLQLEALEQMRCEMLSDPLDEMLNRAIDEARKAQRTIDAQLYDYRSSLEELVQGEEHTLDELTATALRYSHDGASLPGMDEDFDRGLDTLPILCDCGLEWDPAIYDECPVCRDQREAELDEEIEVAVCSTCSALFEVFDPEGAPQTGCPRCEHSDRIYHRPISRRALLQKIESGAALAPAEVEG